jgi:hypothetical protein
MPASPSFSIVLAHFGVWRVAVGALATVSAGSVLAWVGLAAVLDAKTVMAAASTGLVVALAASAAWPATPTLLRWDGRRWQVGTAGATGVEPSAADLSVAIDLGPWMLLRLRPDSAPRWRTTVWLPAQRLGHEAHWHAFRCAVYSPRPAPGGPSEADP